MHMARSRRIMPLLAAATGGLLMPAAAFAAGMPQLNFNTPLTLSQVVWGSIIFIVLYMMLSRSGLPQVESVLAERAARIGTDLEEARAAKAQADAGMAEADQATAKARAEAQSAINAAVDQAKREAAERNETLNARLEKQLQDSEAQINQARNAAMGALRQVATDTAATIITRLSGTPPDQARLDQAVGQALTTRGVG